MRCPACTHENPDAQKFCGECGARLGAAVAPVVTPSSPLTTSTPAAYTPKHLADKILVSRGAVEGERKQVTVVFCDVAGYTALSENLDPEETHAIMDRVFEIVLDAVHRYEGTVNQFLGDGVMALFGAPIAHEDHAERALRATLAIRSGLERVRSDVRQRYGRDFQMRLGVNTGLVVVGAIGRDLRMDYTAVGDTTNLAARLMAVAQPGQIVVSRYTAHQRRDFFVFEDLGEFSVKGKALPVQAFALHDEIRGRTRLAVSKARGLTRFAGREAELGRLSAAWDRVCGGEGAAIAVSGEPGVGKSRLLYEFVEQAEAPVVVDVSCVSHGRAIPFHPIIELLRRTLGVTDTTPEDDVRARIDEQLERLPIEDDDAALIIGHFLGLRVSAEWLTTISPQLKARTLDVVARMLLTAGGDEPVIVIVENIHWADPSSTEFLGVLIERVHAHGLLLIPTLRPGTDADALAGRIECLNVGGLDTTSVVGIVRQLTGARSVGASLVEAITAKAAGNPLYIEEIVSQLRETDGLVVVDGEARLGTASARVPATIHDLIAARVDRLADPLKETLQAASAIGREFAVPLVAEVLGVPDGIDARLTQLHNADFIFPLDTDGPPTYAFKHALTEDVVYAGLLERRRRTYHSRAGRALEAMYRERLDEAVELLAHHFDRADDAEPAVDYAILAAEKAQRRWANPDALARFDGALRRLDAMPDVHPNRLRRIDAVVKQAEVKFALGRHAEHVAALEAIHAVVDAAADPPRRAAWYYWTGYLVNLTGGSPDVSIAYCRQASEIAEAEGLQDLRAYAECCLAHVYMTAGRLDEALKAGEWALTVFEAIGNPWWASRTLWILLPISNALGDWQRGLAYAERALDHASAVGDLRQKIVAFARRGAVEVQRGAVETGLDFCQQALALAPGPFDAAMIQAIAAVGHIKRGDLTAGTTELEKAVEWFARSNIIYTRSIYALWLADGCRGLGEVARSRALAEEVLLAARERGYRHLEGMAERVLGETLAADDAHAAGAHLDEAERILAEVGARNELARTWAAQGRLREQRGDVDGARAMFERALATFEELGTVDEPPRMRAVLDTLAPR